MKDTLDATMQRAILVLNLGVSIASAGWAVAALIRPAILSGSTTFDRGEMFYVRMYAARAIPFGMVTGVLPFRTKGTAIAWLLFTAAAVQIADVAIAVGKKERGMAFAASAGAIVHVLCGLTAM